MFGLSLEKFRRMLHFLLAERFYQNKLFFVNFLDEDQKDFSMDEKEMELEWTQSTVDERVEKLALLFKQKLDKLKQEDKKEISKISGVDED